MNCTQVEKLIPLHAGNDLSAKQAAFVSAHLEHCASCQALAAEFAASRDWLVASTTPAFNEAVFDELRAAVRQKIAQTAPQPVLLTLLTAWWRPRFALTMAGLLLLAGLSFYAYRQQLAPTVKAPPSPIEANLKQPVPATGSADKDGSATTPTIAVQQFSRHRPTRRASLAHTPQVAALLAPNVAETIKDEALALNQDTSESFAPEMLHIELQTADPLIRIIWLAPKAEPVTPFAK